MDPSYDFRLLYEITAKIQDTQIQSIVIIPLCKREASKSHILFSCRTFSVGFKTYIYSHLFGLLPQAKNLVLTKEEILILKAIARMCLFVCEFHKDLPLSAVLLRYLPSSWVSGLDLSHLDNNKILQFEENLQTTSEFRPIEGSIRAKKIGFLRADREHYEGRLEPIQTTLERILMSEIQPHVNPALFDLIISELKRPLGHSRNRFIFEDSTLFLVLSIPSVDNSIFQLLSLPELVTWPVLEETACLSWLPASHGRLEGVQSHLIDQDAGVLVKHFPS